MRYILMANSLAENKEIIENSEDASLEEALPIDSNVGFNSTKVVEDNKINIFLKATSDVPIMKRAKWRVEGNKTVHQVVTFLKKILKFEDKDTLFLYVSQAFAPSPDQQIKNLYDCFGSEGKLVLHYSKTPAWENKSCKIDESIKIPLDEELSYEEIVFNLIKKYNIPCNYHSELLNSIKDFIEDELEARDDDRFQELQVNFHNNYAVCKSRVLLELNKLNSNSLKEKKCSNDSCSEERKAEFRRKYHELIHSGSITESLVLLEYSFALELSNIVLSKDEAIEKLKEKQTIEMEKFVKNIGTTINEEDVNLLSFQHYQATEALKNFWDTKISTCKLSQKKEFNNWIFIIYDDFKQGKIEEILKKLTLRANSKNEEIIQNLNLNLDQEVNDSPLEESFTINLGSQLKSSHNLRLTAINILNLCKINFNSSIVPNPHRIQSAMSLYSNMLFAMVLIVGNHISSYTGIQNKFLKLCSLSTEFHFDELEDQLEQIKYESQLISMNNKTSKENLNPKNYLLEPGDFYITKHSNLSQIHVVYHLVADDSLYSSEINSRHSVILGLRNILKTSYLNDVATIVIPLLLVNELSESMTLQWCIKRAELVLKCIKGFMIEMSSLTPSNDENNNKTLQFLVPSSISEDLFQNLAAMLSSIFRMSNPLVLKD